jgi:CBS domain-containing protein
MASKPITIGESATPRELARVLIERGISGVPVVDGGGRVVGVVSKTDLLQWCVKGGLGFGVANLLSSLADGGIGTRLEAIDLGIVSDFMTATPLTAAEDESLSDVAHRMAEHHVHRLIVVDDASRLQGVVTSMDLLRAFPTAA